jgi:hypothetical protein
MPRRYPGSSFLEFCKQSEQMQAEGRRAGEMESLRFRWEALVGGCFVTLFCSAYAAASQLKILGLALLACAAYVGQFRGRKPS